EEVDMNNVVSSYTIPDAPLTKFLKDHPKDQVIGSIETPVQTRQMTKINEEHDKWAIGTKYVFRDKKDKRGIVVKNKARLVAQGHTQEEGIDYDEVFSPVARIEAIRLFLAYASFKDFVVYQIDVKSDFLYGKIEDESGEDPNFPDKVYKVEKALYGLHQALRACQDKYAADILKKFDFFIVKTASTLMEPNKALVKDAEAEDVDVHLYRSMISSLMYLTASRHDITFSVCACARIQVTPKTSHLHAVKRIFRYLKGKPKLDLWYPKDSLFDLEAYADSDYARASLDRKSITRGCLFLGKRLISWQCKKQTIVANSTTEAEYVVAANCCGQVLWIQNQMLDYGFNFLNTKIYIDNKNETVYKEWEDIMERAAATASSLEAEQDNGNINRTQSMAILNEPLPQGTGSGSGPRRHLNLENSNGISTLPNTKILEQLALIWYASISDKLTFQKGYFSPQWRFLIHTILHCLSHKKTAWEQFSSIIATAIICLATNKTFNFSKMIFEAWVPTPPHHSPLPGGHTPKSDEDSLTLNELTVLCITFSNKVKKLEKTVKTSQARRRAKIVISDDDMVLEDSSKQGRMIEEIDQDVGVILVNANRVHTYSRRRRAVSTGSGEVSTASRIISTAEETVSTAGVSMPVSTAGMVQESTYSPTATKDKGKAIMTESKPEQTTTKLRERQERAGCEAAIRLQEQQDKKENKRISRDVEITQRLQEETDAKERQRMAQVHQAAQTFIKDEWENIRARVKADEELTQRLQAEERENTVKMIE
nr:hypothetical protein [Tanacetum cinerariifolium]